MCTEGLVSSLLPVTEAVRIIRRWAEKMALPCSGPVLLPPVFPVLLLPSPSSNAADQRHSSTSSANSAAALKGFATSRS